MPKLLILALTACLLTADDGKQQQTAGKEQERKATGNETRSRSTSEPATFTGIIDQAGEEWVLSTADQVRPKAILRAKGFKDTNFGRYVGLQVEVRGRIVQEGDKEVLVVSRLADIKETGETEANKPK